MGLSDAGAWTRRHAVGGFAVATVATILAVAFRFVLDPVLPTGYPFLTFFPAVVLTSFIAGWRWGLVAAVLGGATALFFFIPPTRTFAFGTESFTALVAYACIIGIDVLLLKILEDRNDRMRLAETLAAQQAERLEVLLTEVQHRIGNNLQLVGALLQLESRTLVDPDARQALQRAVERLAVVGRIQRTLAEAGDGRNAVAPLLERLATDALESSDARHITAAVTGSASLADGQVPAVALIVLECVNNAIEHAFPAGRTGHLSIHLDTDDRGTIIAVEDDGIGCGSHGSGTSLGTTLCGRLAKGVGGTFSLVARPQGGTRAELVIIGGSPG